MAMRVSSGTVVVVTGAAGGIGRAFAREACCRGASVAFLDSDEEALGQAASSLPRATTHRCDVADLSSVERVRDEVLAAHGRVNLVVSNAGVSAAGPAEAVPMEVFRRTMDVNFWGTVHVARAFLPGLRAAARRGEGATLCNVLSDFALFSLPTKSPYAASKHAARAFTEALAAEAHDDGVRVVAVYPGATATGIVRRGFAVNAAKQDAEAAFLASGMTPEAVALRMLRGIERGTARVLVGRDTRAIDLAVRLAPGLVQAVVRRAWKRVPFL